MALISLFALVAFPSLRVFSQRIHARSLQTSLQQIIEDTQMLAAIRHQKIVLCGSENGRLCAKNWENGWLRKTVSGRVLDVWHFQNAEDRLHYRLFPIGRSSLIFLPSGWPEIENGTFWYCPDGWSSPVWAFTLNRFGRQRQLSPDASGMFYDSQGKRLSC